MDKFDEERLRRILKSDSIGDADMVWLIENAKRFKTEHWSLDNRLNPFLDALINTDEYQNTIDKLEVMDDDMNIGGKLILLTSLFIISVSVILILNK